MLTISMVGEPNTIPVKTAQPVATQPAPTAQVTPEATPVIGKPKKSIFKKWWLWAIVAVIIIGVIILLL